ncbi:MAG TPA: FHA domain-containing protein [Vicinamibacteria bacterium]|nr:FHA domain-containing protein [Vicinamibacteria bacterium]
MRISFGDCVLDLDRRRLVRAGQEVQLTPKAFELLALLVTERPRAVAKSAIQGRFWPGTAGSEEKLTALVTELRNALGDASRRPRYVKAIRRSGYAFGGTATEASDGQPRPAGNGPRFTLEWAGGDVVTLAEGENLIGREEGAMAWIESAGVSRRHARIVISGGRATLEDLGSRNGTVLRGQKVTSPVVLRSDEEIKVGPVPIRFRVIDPVGTAETSVKE